MLYKQISENKKHNEGRKLNRRRNKSKMQWIGTCFNIPVKQRK
jgi:hypothetical protein